MTVSEAVEKAKADGYKRVWLTNDFAFLRADVALDEIDEWQNSGVGPYMMREYADVKVDKEMQNPYMKEKTLMLSVKDNKELSKAARDKCIADAEEYRKAKEGKAK